MSARGKLWAVVLAGGEGRRIAHLTTDRSGRAVPKQFWPFRDGRTLLDWTLERAARVAHSGRIVAVLADAQRAWWRSHVRDLAPGNVLSQPANRGTAVAVLHAVAHVEARDPGAIVLVLPSDHDVRDEGVLARAIAHAAVAAARWPDRVVLLGVRPERADTEYGWILPEPASVGPTVRVRAFVEKPGPDDAERLLREGALWNTLILAARGAALLRAFRRHLPELLGACRPGGAGGLAREAFLGLPHHELGRDLLQKDARYLRMAELPPCGWIDVGTPTRLATWLGRRGRTHEAEPRPAAEPAAPHVPLAAAAAGA
jgi:mannose-1-phosphate guanylyltransferase